MDEAAILAPLRAARADIDAEAALEHVRGAVELFKFGERNRALGTVTRKRARQRWTKEAKKAGKPVLKYGQAGHPPGSETERLVYLLMFVWRHHTGAEAATTPGTPFVAFVRAIAPDAGLSEPAPDSLVDDVKRIKRRVARARREGTAAGDVLDVLGWPQAPSGWTDGPLPPWWGEYMAAMDAEMLKARFRA